MSHTSAALGNPMLIFVTEKIPFHYLLPTTGSYGACILIVGPIWVVQGPWQLLESTFGTSTVLEIIILCVYHAGLRTLQPQRNNSAWRKIAFFYF